MSRALLKLLAIAAAVAAVVMTYRVLHSRRSFDPRVVAHSEVRMWQAYYSGDPRALHAELVGLLRGQFHVATPTAVVVARDLASAAMKFEQSRSNYDEAVLPDLESAYSGLKGSVGGTFDPDAAARAELAWWVARRTPGENAPEQVGELIGRYYATLYGDRKASFREAGVLRARAADLRDEGGAQCDWQQVEQLLQSSYTALLKEL